MGDQMSEQRAKGRKPDYNVSGLNKATGAKGQIGGAWANPDGTISVVLNSFMVFTGGPDTLITLFPNDKSERSSRKQNDDEIPF